MTDGSTENCYSGAPFMKNIVTISDKTLAKFEEKSDSDGEIRIHLVCGFSWGFDRGVTYMYIVKFLLW